MRDALPAIPLAMTAAAWPRWRRSCTRAAGGGRGTRSWTKDWLPMSAPETEEWREGRGVSEPSDKLPLSSRPEVEEALGVEEALSVDWEDWEKRRREVDCRCACTAPGRALRGLLGASVNRDWEGRDWDLRAPEGAAHLGPSRPVRSSRGTLSEARVAGKGEVC